MITISIPAYNEEKTIGEVIAGVNEAMKKARQKFQVVVVDDGSKDNTAEAARKAGAKVFSHPYNYGLAETFRTEIKKFLETDSKIFIHIDADGQYRTDEIPKLLEPILKGEADMVMGSRFMGTIESMPAMKRWGNRAFSRVVSHISGVKITDAQTGYRAFTREVAEKVRIRSNHTYTQEQIIKAIKEKFRVVEVPIYFAARTSGKSRLMSGPFSYAKKAMINILRVYRDYEPLKFFGWIGGIFIILSLLIGAYLLFNIFILGIKVLDIMIPTILLAVLFFVSGIQILLFGFLADKES